MKTTFKNKFSRITTALTLLLALTMLLSGCIETPSTAPETDNFDVQYDQSVNSTSSNGSYTDEAPAEMVVSPFEGFEQIPEYSSEPYVEINDNEPFFEQSEYTTAPFEFYGELDAFGRCTTVYANVSVETMPTDERGSISSVKPSGWQSVTYDFISGKYLYNRCHLIGWQLTGENANKRNLITGTRYLNIDGMLEFENKVAEYVEDTDNHVLYRVTPYFSGGELVARGVLIEAYSVEDGGAGVSFCVYCYNVQPGVIINYNDGTSTAAGTDSAQTPPASSGGTNSGTSSSDVDPDGSSEQNTYVLNTNSKKFHHPDCSSAKTIADKNKQTYTGTREELIDDGYSPCGNCDP